MIMNNTIDRLPQRRRTLTSQLARVWIFADWSTMGRACKKYELLPANDFDRDDNIVERLSAGHIMAIAAASPKAKYSAGIFAAIGDLQEEEEIIYTRRIDKIAV